MIRGIIILIVLFVVAMGVVFVFRPSSERQITGADLLVAQRELAFVLGVRVGQEAMLSKLLSTEKERNAALVRCREEIQRADELGVGKRFSAIDQYRIQEPTP